MMNRFDRNANDNEDDAQLVLQIQQGDEHAFTSFYKRHHLTMYLSAYHILRDEDAANDAVQELFMEVWNRSDRIDASANIKGYLFTVLRNRILSNLNRTKYFDQYVNSYIAFEKRNSCDTEETVIARELQRILDEKIELLPPKMKEVYKLAWEEQLSNKEIAEKLHISEGTVKQHKHQAMRILRSKFPRIMLFAMFFAAEI